MLQVNGTQSSINNNKIANFMLIRTYMNIKFYEQHLVLEVALTKMFMRYSSSSTYSRGKTTSKLDEKIYFQSQEYHPLYLCLVNYQWITNIIEFKLEFFFPFVKLGCFSQLVLEGWINFLFFFVSLSVWIYSNEWINPMLLMLDNKLICWRIPLWKYLQRVLKWVGLSKKLLKLYMKYKRISHFVFAFDVLHLMTTEIFQSRSKLF